MKGKSMMKTGGFVCVLLLFLSLTACMAPKMVPEDRYYRLPDQEAQTRNVPVVHGILGVERLKTVGLLNERAMIFVGDNPLELTLARYHHWQEAPATLIQKNLTGYLARSKAADTVVLYEPGMKVDGLISGRLLRFERREKGATPQVAVSMELAFNGKAKTYDAAVPCVDCSMPAAAQAFGKALRQIYEAFLADQ